MKINKHILFISRLVVGLTFIFSGFVKAVDPVGTMIKINEYFIAFNITWLEPLSLFFAIILCIYEFPLGIAIIAGAKGRLMSWLLFLIMVPFTIITLYIAVADPVSDCGCFGDAVKLSNWGTFYKNVVLLFLTLLILLGRKQIKPMYKCCSEWATITYSSVFIFLIILYGIIYEPLLDFRPYKKGNDIEALMKIPEGAHGDIYETILVYKNTETDKIKEFDIENIPMDDNWEWQETKNKLIKKGAEPKIKDFRLSDSTGKDATVQFLDQSGYKLLVVQHRLDKTNLKAQQKLNDLYPKMMEDGFVKFYAVTSSLPTEVDQYIETHNVPYHFLSADVVTLETIVRSNPGLVLFKDNVVVKKWPFRCMPSHEKINRIVFR